MSTALAVQKTEEQSLVKPSSKREALLMRLNELKVKKLSARELKKYQILTDKTNNLFRRLCWSKFGVSQEQLRNLIRQDLNELAFLTYERSRIPALIQTSILTSIPIVGWIILANILMDPTNMPDHPLFQNVRYFWWYRIMKNKYSNDFEPNT